MVMPVIPNPDIVPLYDDTRLKRVQLATQTKPTGGGLTVVPLPPTGLLRGVQIYITLTVTGTPDAANALGICSAIRAIRLRTNDSKNIYEASGADFVYGINEMLGTEAFVGISSTYNQGASAVSATTFRLDHYLPVAMNWRDPVGLFLLQNREINVNLEIEWEADTVVTGGATATYTASAIPVMEFFTLPSRDSDMPDLSLVHQISTEQRIVSGSGVVQYEPPTGQIYLGMAYGAYWAQSAADSWSRFEEIVGASDYWMNETTGLMDGLNSLSRGRNRRAGTIIRDYMASAGLGMMSTTDRDAFDTLLTTNFIHRFTLTGAGTLRIVKRQLVRVGSN